MSPESNRELCAAAARNNATWCDAMARLHGAAGAFVAAAWINRQPAPRFYPNLVTLDGPHETCAHRVALDRLMRSPPAAGWAVKDCFAALDLGAMGFDPLFEAHWILRPAGAFAATGARRVTSAAMLAAWQQACGEADAAGLFPPALLREPDHAVIAAMQDGAIIGGCIATRSDRVLGISNLFAPAADDGTVRAACLDAAMRFAPAVPLVGYEHGGSFARMTELGFRAIGALRVWQARS
ncbi:MAG TPA: hypothetical protein VJV39_25255 [Dongiaceae bacterium]|nr:hypothetical protein [Dongiaceae bacterium]